MAKKLTVLEEAALIARREIARWEASADEESKAVIETVSAMVNVLVAHWGNRQPQALRLAEALLNEVLRVGPPGSYAFAARYIDGILTGAWAAKKCPPRKKE